ncbi:MAG: glycosyltransferase family 4 protein [Hassallia sp. WJT32-NPBG1]|jgi:glycosyltransferase involved in cell wall biosynthesis|nr:glycosyltransferase family 4 protein [Hassallia sp. WJT32-NPBG1]
MKPLAIVTPWFGKDLKGGAEQQAWQIATRLAQRGHQVEVLTTCCRSFQDDWATNHLKAGVTQEQGLHIRRFAVDKRDHASFDRINSIMLNLHHSLLKPGVNPVSENDAAKFCSENINSKDLLNYLKKYQQNYQAFLFIPYLYGLILNGLPIVANRAFLQPCLHDEVYAYLPQIANIIHLTKGLLFISEGEAQLARQLYGPGIITKSFVAGAGIEAGTQKTRIIQIKNFQIKQERYILCLGRRDTTKNTDLLVRAYAAFKQKNPRSNLKLVFAGTGNPSFLNSVTGLVDLGLVVEREKEALLANCLALFQPSQNESYSRVIMEAWFYSKPTAAHRRCLATAMAVESAKGGWLADTEIEWAELLAEIDKISEEQLVEYGVNGQVYANENAVWDKVIQHYETALELTPKAAIVKAKSYSRKLKEIHQLLPNLAYGDAISNHALAIRDYLRSCGYKSDIFVKYVDEQLANQVTVFQPKCINRQAGLIYHHSIGSELTNYAIAHPANKCLIYHNITPAEFFAPYRPEFAKILEQGRLDLKDLASHFPVSVGDSAYNASELAACGFPNPGVLPIAIDPSKWDISPDPELMEKLQDGRANLLFVGRLAPNKRQDHLVEAFAHYLRMEREARLILVGSGDINDPYLSCLMNLIQRLGLTDNVMLPGKVNDAQLLAFYQTAHLLWSMSEHEGFCVPLIEAMWFDIPILAYKSTAIPETLGEAGLMFTSKDDLAKVAAAGKMLVRDEDLRAKVIKAQRKRRNFFLSTIVFEQLNNIISQMENI